MTPSAPNLQLNTGPIVVVGAVTRDTLIYPKRLPAERLGGILYGVITLARMTGRQIIPVANVGHDVYEELLALLRDYENISTSGLRCVASANPHSYIVYASEYGSQCDQGRVEPVSFEQLKPYLGAALFLVSFPTGYDLRLATLRRLSLPTDSRVYLDYHILALARDRMGTRYLKRRHNWLEWLRCATFLQLNRFEAEQLAGCRLAGPSALRDFAHGVLKVGPAVVTITLGALGSFVAYRTGGQTRSAGFAAAAVDDPVGSTGCGDVYAAAFVADYLEAGNVEHATEVANATAAVKAAGCDMGELALGRRPIAASLLMGESIDGRPKISLS